MARWQPPNNVGKHERVGRRLFAEPLLAGGEAQKPFAGLDLRNFEETRDDKTSLDRLGRGNVEKAVVRYLLPRARVAGSTFTPPKPFNGWAVVQAKYFEDLPAKRRMYSTPVVASPVNKPDLEENIYHAHVVTPAGIDEYLMALHLRYLVEKYGSIEPVPNDRELPNRTEKLKRWALAKWERVTRFVRRKT